MAATMQLYSGGSETITDILDDGVFGGIFASSSQRAALSHGDTVTEFELSDDQILTDMELNYDDEISSKAFAALTDIAHYLDDEKIDRLWNIVADDGCEISENDLDLFPSCDRAEAGWEAQRIRGEIARRLGYKAVTMRDEHGLSYLVLSR